MDMPDAVQTPPRFDAGFCRQLDTLIRWRRDVRHFRPDPLPPGLIERMLDLMACTPSVGFSQPSRFVLVESIAVRDAVRRNFVACNDRSMRAYSGERAALYARLKLEGLDQAPVQLAVFCDEATPVGEGLGQQTMPETRRYSVVTAIQTLWLALRAEGIGLGWVSILDPVRLAADLQVPSSWAFVAYCCIGYPQYEQDEPELLRHGWAPRDPAAATLLRR